MDPQLQEDLKVEKPAEQCEAPNATNELPSPEPDIEAATPVQVDEQGEHAAFLPTLQFTSGNDLSSIAHYDAQQSGEESLRTGNEEPTSQTFDHWPTDTQTQIQNDGPLQEVNHFVQGDSANQFAQASDQNDYDQNVSQDQQQQQQHLQQQQHQFQHQQQQQQQQQHYPQQHHPHFHQHPHHHGGTPYDRPILGASYGTYDGSKPKRKRASPQQLTLLNNIFEMTYFPSSDLRLAIGKELDMVPRSVQIWFQNRRSLWRAKAGQILNENKQRKEELMATGLTDAEADAKVTSDRADAAARQIADQRANDAVEYAINGNNGSLAYALHGANMNQNPSGLIDDGSVTRDDEAGAWSVLQAFHQARTGVLVQQGHHPMPQRPDSQQQQHQQPPQHQQGQQASQELQAEQPQQQEQHV